jgi:uncharacterized protein YndB with AHSA1/START domain
MAESPLEQKPQLRIVRRYPVAREKVWQAWTEPQALSRWFGPGPADSVTLAELDVREGGSYRIAFASGGERHEVGGVYQVVRPHERLVFSWAWHTTPERVSRISLALREVEGGTELEFVQDRFFDRQARDNHARGWTGTFAKLDALLGA